MLVTLRGGSDARLEPTSMVLNYENRSHPFLNVQYGEPGVTYRYSPKR